MGLSSDELIAAGWPDEKMLEASARNRLRVALNALRNEGLRDLLVTGTDGYRPDASTPLLLTPPEMYKAWPTP